MSAGGSLDFDSIDWADDQPDIHSRAASALGQRWAIVEYEAGAAREEWCTDGHRGYVLAGRIEYEFDDGSPFARGRAGSGVLPRRRHRPPRPESGTDGDAALPDRRSGVISESCFPSAR